jgi:hypothetical protein
MERFPGKPSPAMVVACVALVFAVAGTSLAATQIGKNSVGAKELGAVKLRTASEEVAGSGVGDAVASCKRGEQLLGGGATFSGVTSVESAAST